jgi:pre-mRNA-processing factor 40
MRATIKDPQYRALKDPKDRKAAFEKYAVEVRMQEKDRAKERLAKLRADFGTMLRSHPEIKHYTRWKTARPIIEGETIFRSTSDDTERRQLYEEYIVELKKSNIEREAITRKSAMDELVGILKALNLEPYTRWSEAHEMIQSDENFQGDDKFKTLSKSDILTAFENHIKSLERTFNDERQRGKASKIRRERQNRDRFLELLNELREAGKVKAGTKWMQVFPEISEDSRYVAMLGQPGSTPLDLFWDMVEEEERALRLVRNDVYDVLEDKRYEITPKTTLAEFLSVMSTDRRTAPLSHDTLELIFNRLQEKVLRRTEDDKHASERHQRRLIDSLRSKIKHLDKPPVQSTSTWESIRPHISHLDEFKALDSDDLRRQAFDKVIRRLKDKEEDAEKEREKNRNSKSDRDRDRDRDRDHNLRNGHSSHHLSAVDRHVGAGRRSRSPELDAYEADRRKAMADRERQYHKSGIKGLSPPLRDRLDPRDRHERLSSRHADQPRLSHYDRDRRERDEERVRLYRTRGEPRLGRDELDYGESRSAGRRRRGADSDGESVGSGRKRARRERDETLRRDRTPVKVIPKEEPGVHSGSEEGEMVEED